MSIVAVLQSSLRKAHNLRIIVVITIFFFLASISQYQGPREFSIDGDGQVQSVHSESGENDIHYTHHIASYNPRDIRPWTKGDTLALTTPEGLKVVEFLTASPQLKPSSRLDNGGDMQHSKLDQLQSELVDQEFLHLTKRLRVFKQLWHSFQPYYEQLEDEDQQSHFYISPPSDVAPAIELFQKMERILFPWIHKYHETSFDLYREMTAPAKTTDNPRKAWNTRNQGIVMCVGDKHSIYARTTIKVLRELLGSKLPIEIFYAGEQDLSKENREWFEKIDDVTTVDITTKLDQDLLRISGPTIKPFAILASRFQEVILMDADAYFLQDPAILFEDGGYKEVGTVFFYDRTRPNKVAGVNKKSWLYTYLPSVSNHPSKTRWYRSKGDQDQDSGVVVLDKKIHFLGLLAICKMNDVLERNQATYRATWGEKESFWIAMEMVQERYSFIRFGGGVIGDLGDAIPYRKDGDSLAPLSDESRSGSPHVRMDRVCGNQLHFNYKGQPLWWNSGLTRDKAAKDSPYLKYTAWMHDEYGNWDIEHSCLVPTFHGAIMEVDWNHRQTAFEMLRLDQAVAQELNQPEVKSIITIPRLIKTDGVKGGKGNNQAV
ncbi:mannosyltransferase putative-domain-containing protein [Mortierella sp. GBAus27b]|nr:hypothetical protein BGX31_008631 [Mortierella sp. GBA43]KAI8347265.1 mannosyltransferase putative-domain-containing protein [Mortierella sp. GBAus27b]